MVLALGQVSGLRASETAPPPVEALLAASETTNLYIVQFVTQPLEQFRTAIRNLGGTVLPRYVPRQPSAVGVVSIRWV